LTLIVPGHPLSVSPVVEAAPPCPPAAIEIQVMGGFRLFSSGAEVPLSEATERLLGFLAVRNRPLNRLQVAGTFWPDASEKQALANLRSALWRMAGPSYAALDVGLRSLGLQAGVRVDLSAAVSLADRIIDKRQPLGDDELADASDQLREDLLVGWYDDWALQESERWRQRRLHALEALSQRFTQAGQFAAALDSALLCVAADPLRESAHAEVITAHLAEHNRSEAIRAFDRCCCILRDELGLEPSDHLRSLLTESHTTSVMTSRIDAGS
jgi:DNA-binding SARP family transcriptional activator